MSTEYGAELVAIVQIDQPLCNRVYGDGFDSPLDSPLVGCQAILGTTGTRKCFNTRFTCQDAENYDPGTLTLTFSRAQEGLEYLGYVIPSLEDVGITPLAINIGAMDRNLSAFGEREVVRLQFADHQHSDHKVDKYRLERHDGTADADGATYDPYERGTFWGKWLARNPYHEGYALRVYQGTVGQLLAEMEVRHYLIDQITGPADGAVTVTAVDLFSRAEDRKAKAPAASRGELASGITAGEGSATLSPTGIGDLDYPASGRVAIGNEIIAFTRSADTLTLTTRGDLNTAAEAHDAEDKVQIVLSYEGQEAQDIVHDLLTTYAGIDAARITLADWDAEAAANFSNLYTAHIAEPTPVGDLAGELAEQVGFTLWPDVVSDQIRMKAIVQTITGEIAHTVDDDNWIKAGTFSITRIPEQRVSQVWVYYGLINPLEDIDEKGNYRSRVITADLNAEDDTQYGSASVREVFSRWIPQFGRTSATEVGERLLDIFRDPPFRAAFELHASREGLLDLAEPFRLSVAEVQNAAGENQLTTQLPIQLSREEDAIAVESQQLQFFVEAGEDSPGANERELFIDNDTNDFNLRTEHDALFTEPVSGDIVRCTIANLAVVGSSSTGTPAWQTGSWPAGVTLILDNSGRIAGRGGNGVGSEAAGQDGGTAMEVTAPLNVNNVNGIIAGGGGGGGGGGGNTSLDVSCSSPLVFPGSGGGGGAGRNPGNGASGLNDGADGTLTSGGSGGAGDGFAFCPTTQGTVGAGGDGGDPGDAGQNGGDATGGVDPKNGGDGGSAGSAIDGIANATFVDENGDPTVNQGTILGPTA